MRHLHKVWLLVWTFMLVVLLLVFQKYAGLRTKNSELSKEIEKIRMDNGLLAEKVLKLKTDREYAAKIARQKLGLAEKGEVIYKILPDEQNSFRERR